jgi:hypothetical protein
MVMTANIDSFGVEKSLAMSSKESFLSTAGCAFKISKYSYWQSFSIKITLHEAR